MEPVSTDPDDLIRKRKIELKDQREALLDLEPEKIQENILAAPQPAALVHSFPEEDFYFLVHTIGPEDALPILKLASDRQWEYIVDQEAWQKDQFHLPRLTHWFYLLFKADPVRFPRWCLQKKSPAIKFYLFRNIEMRIREHDQDPMEFGPDFMTDDDVYYFRLIDYPADDTKAVWTKEQRNELIPELLSRISIADHIEYQNLLMETASTIPAEIEEEEYRLRNVRLAEKGFLPYDQAVGVYQFLPPEEIGRKGKKVLPRAAEPLDLAPMPLFAHRALSMENLFTRTLGDIRDDSLLLFLQTEFAALCNQIIAADQKLVQDRKDLSFVVKKAGGYLSIGLEVLTQPHLHKHAASAKVFLRKYLLSEIFRVGYGQALNLKWRAEKWRRESWFQTAGLPLAFWGEAWLGVLGGLLVQKPLFYDNYQTGELYREFADLADIQKTAAVLEEIITVDLTLSMMEIQLPETSIKKRLSYKNLLLTLWADHHTGIRPDSKTPIPIPLSDFRYFFKELWSTETPGVINDTVKAIFLDWLAVRSGLPVVDLSRKMGHILTDLFEEIEMEMGAISIEHLDPRFILLFLVR